QVIDAIFQHGDAIDAHAPGKALIFVGVEAAIPEHVGMDHAAAEDFEPIVALAEADFPALARALDVDLGGRLREGKKRRAKAHLDAWHLEERLAELLEDPFQMAKMARPV